MKGIVTSGYCKLLTAIAIAAPLAVLGAKLSFQA
jgi:hypothetical protein